MIAHHLNCSSRRPLYENIIDRCPIRDNDLYKTVVDNMDGTTAIEAIAIILQRKKFTTSDCTEIKSLIGTEISDIIELLLTISNESGDQNVLKNSLQTILFLLKDGTINEITEESTSFLLEIYDNQPIEITNIIKKCFEQNPEKIFEMGLPEFVFSHENIIPYYNLFPIFAENIESFSSESNTIILGIFTLMESGFVKPEEEALNCIIILLNKQAIPEEFLQRLFNRLSFLIFSEEEKIIIKTLDIYIILDQCPLDSSFIIQLLSLLKVNRIGVHVTDFLIHFAEQFQPMSETIRDHLCYAIDNASYEISTRCVLAIINYLNETDEETNLKLLELFASHLENNPYKLELLKYISSILPTFTEAEKAQDIISDNIETFYNFDDDSDDEIRDLADAIISFTTE